MNYDFNTSMYILIFTSYMGTFNTETEKFSINRSTTDRIQIHIWLKKNAAESEHFKDIKIQKCKFLNLIFQYLTF